MVTRGKAKIFKPKVWLASIYSDNPSSDLSLVEPTNITDALSSLAWKSAMKSKYLALHGLNTWTLIPSSSDYNVVGCKWVFRLRKSVDGSVQRHKAHLVAKGFI
ncbi:uncharacterized mitochondrial protein AtMg00820-like [Benincasa hispida]|uniref:uncharacterized mitochondrial protein AtMg00820-like n=1 Tax=Benincasa hispida TaxID=102211 RepID=UPI001901E571|nr:uncharacterized mitochondrial protein AtMg00820-like [Benincasa hispida]